MKRRGWKAVRRSDNEVKGWVRNLPALALFAAEGLFGRGWWGYTGAQEPPVKDLASPEEAAACAEATGRKLLARSLRLLLGTGPLEAGEVRGGRVVPVAVSSGARQAMAESLRRLTAAQRRELLRQLLREVEKGGGA